MGLPRIDTAFFQVAHTDDPDVDAGDRPKGWVPADAVTCRPGATRLRVRALTGPELHAVPRAVGEDVSPWLLGLARAGLHPDDRDTFDALPWSYSLGVGAVILDASSPAPDPTSAPSSAG